METPRSFFYSSLLILFHGMNLLMAQQSSYKEKIYGIEFELPMVYVKGGDFVMGSKKTEVGHFGDEGPQHGVTLNAFWMSQVEITWDLYNLFVSRASDQYQIKKDETSEVAIDVDAVSGATTPYVEMSFGMGTDGYPAICMTQLAAVKFCECICHDRKVLSITYRGRMGIRS